MDTVVEDRITSLAITAYNAYGSALGWKGTHGSLSDWDHLSDAQQSAWKKVVVEVATETFTNSTNIKIAIDKYIPINVTSI